MSSGTEKAEQKVTAAQREAEAAHRRLVRAEMLIALLTVEKKTRPEAWRMVHPDSTANDSSATDLYKREVRWYQQTSPMTLRQALALRGLTIETLVADINELREARYVTSKGEHTDSPDNRIRLEAVKMLAHLLGNLMGTGRREINNQDKDAEPTRTPETEAQNIIAGVDKMSPQEFSKEKAVLDQQQQGDMAKLLTEIRRRESGEPAVRDNSEGDEHHFLPN